MNKLSTQKINRLIPVICIILPLFASGASRKYKSNFVVGKPLPKLEFKDINGNIVNTDQLRGKVILIDFWATWCGPCRAEMPNLLSVYNEFKDKDLEIIGISLDSDRQKLTDYLERSQIPWPVHYDGKKWNNSIASRFNIRAIPEIVLIDKKGIVRKTGLKGEQIRKYTAMLLGQSTKKHTGALVDPKEWKEEYTIELSAVNDVTDEKFGIDWFRPHTVSEISPEKPGFIKSLPKFKYEMQQYLTFQLGNSQDNRVWGVVDYQKSEEKYFSFDLYLDKNRDGHLENDYVEDVKCITGIQVPYIDNTTEPYSLFLYSFSNAPRFAYQSKAGRYGTFNVGKAQIQLLVIDDTGNGIFNDDKDILLMDWDMDGTIDGSHQAKEYVSLYSQLRLPGVIYQVKELDSPGRRMILQKVNDETQKPGKNAEQSTAKAQPDAFVGLWKHSQQNPYDNKIPVLRIRKITNGKIHAEYIKEFFSYKPVFWGSRITGNELNLKFILMSSTGKKTHHKVSYQLKREDDYLTGRYHPSWKEPCDIRLIRAEK